MPAKFQLMCMYIEALKRRQSGQICWNHRFSNFSTVHPIGLIFCGKGAQYPQHHLFKYRVLKDFWSGFQSKTLSVSARNRQFFAVFFMQLRHVQEFHIGLSERKILTNK